MDENELWRRRELSAAEAKVGATLLTVLHPEVRPLIRQLHSGLMPLRLGAEERLSLVVKTQKEAILAAKMNGGFAFYLPVIPSTTVTTTALITAFFDDQDQPLTVRTPLFGDDSLSEELLEILEYDEVDIYFFDEHDYEWMSFRTSLEDGGSWLRSGEEMYLLSYHAETVKSIHQALTVWFGQRTSHDDECAIRAVFKSELFRNDVVVLDMTPQVNSYQGSAGFRHDALTRTDPGYFQERDISACLLRAFAPEKVMMNPRRRDTFKEILDHLILTDTLAILIQAKDSPTTETGIQRTIDRKRRAAHGQIKDAIRQINGAAKYLGREAVAKLVVGGQDVDISIGTRRVIGLAIVKELFPDEGGAYTAACADLGKLSGGGLVMDYFSFHLFTHHFASEAAFTEALDVLIQRTKTAGWFPVNDSVLDNVIDWIDGTRKGGHDSRPNL